MRMFLPTDHRAGCYEHVIAPPVRSELTGYAVAFCLKNVRRAWQGSILSKEVLKDDSLKKMAGTGLEPATLRL